MVHSPGIFPRSSLPLAWFHDARGDRATYRHDWRDAPACQSWSGDTVTNGIEEAPHFMRTFKKRDDVRLSSATEARRGLKRPLALVALIAPLVLLLALIATPGNALASGRGHGITVTPDNGPAGTHVTVTGSGFTGGASITVGYSSGDCSSGITVISGATGTAGSDGSANVSFQWPSTQPGDYHVCLTTGGATFPSD